MAAASPSFAPHAKIRTSGIGHDPLDFRQQILSGHQRRFTQQLAPRRVGRAIHLFEPYARAERRRDEQGEILDCQYFPSYRAPLPRDSLLG